MSQSACSRLARRPTPTAFRRAAALECGAAEKRIERHRGFSAGRAIAPPAIPSSCARRNLWLASPSRIVEHEQDDASTPRSRVAREGFEQRRETFRHSSGGFDTPLEMFGRPPQVPSRPLTSGRPYFLGRAFSSARLSSRTLTRGSPKIPRLRAVMWRSTRAAICSGGAPRALATRGA